MKKKDNKESLRGIVDWIETYTDFMDHNGEIDQVGYELIDLVEAKLKEERKRAIVMCLDKSRQLRRITRKEWLHGIGIDIPQPSQEHYQAGLEMWADYLTKLSKTNE